MACIPPGEYDSTKQYQHHLPCSGCGVLDESVTTNLINLNRQTVYGTRRMVSQFVSQSFGVCHLVESHGRFIKDLCEIKQHQSNILLYPWWYMEGYDGPKEQGNLQSNEKINIIMLELY